MISEAVRDPDEPWSKIVHNLWQGGGDEAPTKSRFDTVLTLSRTAHRLSPVDSALRPIEHFWPIDDGFMPPEDVVRGWARFLHDSRVRLSRRVLVRCQAGLNRSGLVVARTLMEDDLPADRAIRLIRQRRSPGALSNRYFEDWLRLEGGT